LSTYEFTEQALVDMTEAGDYLARDNQAAARDFVEAIESRCLELALMPNAGKMRDEIMVGLRSGTAHRYTIFYLQKQAKHGGITILRVLHSARDLETIMRLQAQEYAGDQPQ
jgi:toxin ParE1/3/4